MCVRRGTPGYAAFHFLCGADLSFLVGGGNEKDFIEMDIEK
jgi:hypothetical protein